MYEMEQGAYLGKDEYDSRDSKSLPNFHPISEELRSLTSSSVHTLPPCLGPLVSKLMSDFNPHVMLARKSPLSRRRNSSRVAGL